MAKEEHKKHTAYAAHKKVMDVTRPGKAPASPTSRPVISTSNPPVADDQFVPSAPPLRASDPSVKHDLMDSKKRKELQPLDSAAAGAEETVPTLVGAPVLPDQQTPDVSVASDAPEVASTSIPAAAAEPVTEAAASEPKNETATATPAANEQPKDQPTVQGMQPDVDSAAHLALEQTVEATKTDNPTSNDNLPIWEHPDTSEQVEPSSAAYSGTADAKTSKSIEDLLAETGAPTLEPDQSPSMIVSHHHRNHHKWWEPILIFLLIVIVAAIVVDVLLDMEIIRISISIPHTDLL
jgi:hypothetical protein